MLSEAAKWAQVRTGTWAATEGKTISIKGKAFEYCHILSGKCEITAAGGDTYTFDPGDIFGLKPGFTGTWTTLETLRKIYGFAS